MVVGYVAGPRVERVMRARGVRSLWAGAIPDRERQRALAGIFATPRPCIPASGSVGFQIGAGFGKLVVVSMSCSVEAMASLVWFPRGRAEWKGSKNGVLNS